MGRPKKIQKEVEEEEFGDEPIEEEEDEMEDEIVETKSRNLPEPTEAQLLREQKRIQNKLAEVQNKKSMNEFFKDLPTRIENMERIVKNLHEALQNQQEFIKQLADRK